MGGIQNTFALLGNSKFEQKMIVLIYRHINVYAINLRSIQIRTLDLGKGSSQA